MSKREIRYRTRYRPSHADSIPHVQRMEDGPQVDSQSWGEPDGRRMPNVQPIVFGKAQMDWPPVTGGYLFDAPSGGNPLEPVLLMESVTIMRGVRPVFDPGDLMAEIRRVA